MLSRWLVGIILLFTILIMLLPGKDERSISRIGSASMLACTRDLRNQVEAQVVAEKPVTITFRNTCPDLIATLKLNERGEMTITGNKHPVRMKLYPVVANGKVRWSCYGEPVDRVTKLCKP